MAFNELQKGNFNKTIQDDISTVSVVLKHSKKIKVLHIIDSGGLYGAETMLLNLIAEQSLLGIKATIASIGEKRIKEKAIENEAIKRGFDIKKFRMTPGFNLLGAHKIIKFATHEHYDILHSHGYKGNILFGFMPNLVKKIPLITTVHGYTSKNAFSKIKIYEILDSMSHHLIDQVVLVDQSMLMHPLLRRQKNVNYNIIRNGIPEITPYVRLCKSEDKIIDFCMKGFTIGAIGRLSPEKGFDNLIDATSKLIKKRNNIQLIILGEGKQRFHLEKKVYEFGIDQHVMMPGYIQDAKQYLQYFDVFILPSHTEGLPVTILEAMQSQVPIVATSVGGVAEALDYGNAGILIDSSDSKKIADAVLAIITHPEKAMERIKYGKKHVKNKYSIRKMTRKYVDVYTHLLRSYAV
ncbi:glycosyl transferase [Desulfosarcina widdelii]|uniref:Glycosyl transferase n=1 Tax=Desulfosarcina widdelii TaxID=947919 RepID=A0A5K7Z927_9BACT|nr:glycosyltransferase [Desulfosarcina widdelii]BBO72967.1 glycosyl transferase [Desulfosarcina widdelii]